MQNYKTKLFGWIGAILFALGSAFMCTYEPAPGYDVIWWLYGVALICVFAGGLCMSYSHNPKGFVRSAFAVISVIPNVYRLRRYDRGMYNTLKNSGIITLISCAYDEGLYYYDCTRF